jgi:hypothetical protein
VDHFERSHFLGNEQHFFAARDRGGDDVGDGLGLTLSGRSFDH